MTLEYHDALLHDITKDLVLTNSNLKSSSTEVNQQGAQMKNIQNKLDMTSTNIKNTDQTFLIIERKEKIYRIFLYLIILLEFITIVVLITNKIVKIFK